MKKIVTTTMSETGVTINISSECESVEIILPFTIVSPQTALHLASALSQDATLAKPSVESESVSE